MNGAGGPLLRRVVLAELGGEGQAVSLGRALRDAGFEVIYVGRLTTREQVTATVDQEDPDTLGLAFDAGTDTGLLTAAADAVDGVRVFGWGPPSGALDQVFEDETELTAWLAGGVIHTPESPSDRPR